MIRRPHDDVESWPSALSWLRTAWTTLPVAPARLHTRDIDGELGQRYSPQFVRILVGLSGWRTVPVQDICRHPTLPRTRHGDIEVSSFECPDCQGSGLHLVDRDLYDHPMYVALRKLSKVVRSRHGTPAPIDMVMALAWCGWNLDRASGAIGLPIVSPDHRQTVEAMFLLSVRNLHSRYSSGPPPAKSQSQQDAESAA
jgi:hypothetical protein